MPRFAAAGRIGGYVGSSPRKTRQREGCRRQPNRLPQIVILPRRGGERGGTTRAGRGGVGRCRFMGSLVAIAACDSRRSQQSTHVRELQHIWLSHEQIFRGLVRRQLPIFCAEQGVQQRDGPFLGEGGVAVAALGG